MMQLSRWSTLSVVFLRAAVSRIGICAISVLAILIAAAPYHAAREQSENVLWTDPGDPSALDFQYGFGGAERQPQPPFHFVDEDLVGTSPKVDVTDARGETWNVKWGPEARPSVFCTRLVWACGYIVAPEFFIAKGKIDGVHGLKRAGSHLSRNGSFVNARFQLRSSVPAFMADNSWSWIKNPFTGTPQLQGLKILMLLVSNWDAKDARDMFNTPRRGVGLNTNLGIFQDDSNGITKFLYADDDWGSSMGKWGNTFTWTKWDYRGFAAQTSDFLKVTENGLLKWGFSGKHERDLTGDITVNDIEWLLKYLGRITDEQIRVGLKSSGATPQETEGYAVALRERIEKLQQIAAKIPSKQAGK